MLFYWFINDIFYSCTTHMPLKLTTITAQPGAVALDCLNTFHQKKMKWICLIDRRSLGGAMQKHDSSEQWVVNMEMKYDGDTRISPITALTKRPFLHINLLPMSLSLEPIDCFLRTTAAHLCRGVSVLNVCVGWKLPELYVYWIG